MASAMLSPKLIQLVVIICSINVTEGEDTVASLAEQLRELKETLRQRDALDQQQQSHISRLAEDLQTLTTSVEGHVTTVESDSNGASCSTLLTFLQSRLTILDDLQNATVSQSAQLMEIEQTLESMRNVSTFRDPAQNTQANCIDNEQLEETRDPLGLTTPSLTPTCSYPLTSIESPIVVGPITEYYYGFWGHDAMRNDSIIYVLNGYGQLYKVREYRSAEDFQQQEVYRVHNLTKKCATGGIVIRNRHLYCPLFMDFTRNYAFLLMFNLDTDQFIRQRFINGIERVYLRGPHLIDLFADDSWVWLVYGREGGSNIRLDKLNPETLDTVATFETQIPLGQIGHTFVICGVVYSLSRENEVPGYIQHVYNLQDQTSCTLEEGDIVMPITSRYCFYDWNAFVGKLHYDPWDQALYALNCWFREKYPVQLAQQCH